MKTLLIEVLILALCCACNNGKSTNVPKSQSIEETSIENDTSYLYRDSIEAAVAIPKNADELFDDFIYNYAGNESFQKKRTIFPLPYIKEGIQSFIEEKEWTHDHLFTKENYYTLLYDGEDDMELEKNLSVDTVTVEWIYLDTHEIKQYHFQRNNGIWMLTNMEQHSTLNEPYENFLEFFYRFSNDSTFQREHISIPLKFVTSDPDDEFQVLETTLSVDQWFAFKPLLPRDKMTNFDYGQTYAKHSRTKIIDMRGVGNGFSNTLFFKRIGKEWKLVQFDDLSN